jgi:hypothetical protein
MQNYLQKNFCNYIIKGQQSMKIKVQTVELIKKIYIVELNDGDEPQWACDTVVMGEVEPVSSEFLDFSIFDYQEIKND